MSQPQVGDGGARSTYRERMPVPIPVWIVTLALWVLFAVALGLTLGPWIGIPLLVAGAAGLVLGLRAATGRVEVSEGVLVAGRASLPVAVAGRVTELDAAAARVLRGTGADSRAYLYLRSWVPTAVRVDVADPGDPTPYWYVSTRRPTALAAAVEAARGEAGR